MAVAEARFAQFAIRGYVKPEAKKGGKRENARIVRKCVNSRRVRAVLHSSAEQSVIRAVNLLLIKREFRTLMNSFVYP
jgi:hypothetical protein